MPDETHEGPTRAKRTHRDLAVADALGPCSRLRKMCDGSLGGQLEIGSISTSSTRRRFTRPESVDKRVPIRI